MMTLAHSMDYEVGGMTVKNSVQSCSKEKGHTLSIVYILIVVFAFNNYISIALHFLFGLGKISYVLIDIVFLIMQ